MYPSMYRLSSSDSMPAEKPASYVEDILDAIQCTNPGIISSLIDHGYDYYDALKLLNAVVIITLKKQ